MADDLLLPIKLVFPRRQDYRPPPRARVDPTLLEEVTPERRRELAQQVQTIKQHFSASFSAWPGVPAVARVALKPQAAAKSHRPHYLFNKETCPIIGGGRLCELFVSVRPAGLDRLVERILYGATRYAEPNISTLLDWSAPRKVVQLL